MWVIVGDGHFQWYIWILCVHRSTPSQTPIEEILSTQSQTHNTSTRDSAIQIDGMKRAKDSATHIRLPSTNSPLETGYIQWSVTGAAAKEQARKGVKLFSFRLVNTVKDRRDEAWALRLHLTWKDLQWVAKDKKNVGGQEKAGKLCFGGNSIYYRVSTVLSLLVLSTWEVQACIYIQTSVTSAHLSHQSSLFASIAHRSLVASRRIAIASRFHW